MKKRFPQFLDDRISVIRAAEDAAEMMGKLTEGTPEYAFARQQVTALEQELEASQELVESLIDRLPVNAVVKTAARLRFIRGAMWKEITFITGKSETQLKNSISKAIVALNEEGTEAGEDSAPPPG